MIDKSEIANCLDYAASSVMYKPHHCDKNRIDILETWRKLKSENTNLTELDVAKFFVFGEK